jgi:hypothetical protein
MLSPTTTISGFWAGWRPRAAGLTRGWLFLLARPPARLGGDGRPPRNFFIYASVCRWTASVTRLDSTRLLTLPPGILRKNSGIPKIGDKKSAHQARFPSSPINRSPNSVFSDYRQIRIIRTHRNSSESPNSVIRVTRITELFGYSVIRVTRITEYSVIRVTRIKPNLAINLEVRYSYGTCLMPLWPSHHLIN